MVSTKKKRRKSLNSRASSEEYKGFGPENLPAHVAIIMDGNGRWATRRKLSRINGHNKAGGAVRAIVRTCRELGIPHLTLYAFSTENWERSKEEVTALMMLMKKFLKSERKELIDNDIRLNAIGQIDRLPKGTRNELDQTMMLTRENTGMILTLALSYGSREEITKAVKEIAADVVDKKIAADSISTELISRHLYTGNMPDPDLVIRTSGEMRISNFLLWQIAYAELYFTDTLWPDFGKEEFVDILKNYQLRERRFGKVPHP
jgi:undecaprenyl diphosphate synthase